MQIHPVGAKLIRADGQTDRNDDASSYFSLFYERV